MTALPVKVPGGNGGGIVAGGQVVHLFQPDHAVFLTRPHFGGIEDGGGRRALGRFRALRVRRQRRAGQSGQRQHKRGGEGKQPAVFLHGKTSCFLMWVFSYIGDKAPFLRFKIVAIYLIAGEVQPSVIGGDPAAPAA